MWRATLRRKGLEVATLVLAEELQAELAGADAPDKGVNRSPYYLLERASVPAVIVELGYVTNPEEGARLTTETYQNTLAEAISRAVLTFLQLDPQSGAQSGGVQPLYDEARAYCTGEKFSESALSIIPYTMLTERLDTGTEFFYRARR